MRNLIVFKDARIENVELDDQTAIGITVKGFDVTSPDVTRVNFSNSFTLPLTRKNTEIFENCWNAYSTVSTPQYLDCEYFVDNNLLIQGKICITKMEYGRLTAFIFDWSVLWDNLKFVRWENYDGDINPNVDSNIVYIARRGFQKDYVYWLIDKLGSSTAHARGYFNDDDPYVGSIRNIVDRLVGTSNNIKEHLQLRAMVTNDEATYSTSNVMTQPIKWVDDEEIVHYSSMFVTTAASIINYIEDKFNVTLQFDDTTYQNLQGLLIPMLGLVLRSENGNVWIDSNPDGFYAQDFSLYDFLKVLIQTYSLVVTREEDVYTFRTLNNITDIPVDDTLVTNIVENSLTWQAQVSDKYKQSNYVTYASCGENSDLFGQSAKLITIDNKSLELGATNAIMQVKAFLPDYITEYGYLVPDLRKERAAICLFKDGLNETMILTADNINMSVSLPSCNTLSFADGFDFLEKIMEVNKCYTFRTFISPDKILNKDNFMLVQLPKLNGKFWVNSIEGINGYGKQSVKMTCYRIN